MKTDDHLIAEAWKNNISTPQSSTEILILDTKIKTVLIRLKERGINIDDENFHKRISELVYQLLPIKLQAEYTPDIIIQRLPQISLDENLGPLGSAGTQPGAGTILTMRSLPKKRKRKKKMK
jgi:hypothetical protein